MIERPARRLSATTKFYAGFCLVAAIVIGLAFYVGYHAGSAHAQSRSAARNSDAP